MPGLSPRIDERLNPTDFLTSGSDVSRLCAFPAQLSWTDLAGLASRRRMELTGARTGWVPLGFPWGFGRGGLGVMPTGTIARLLIDKGFGFIRDEGGIEHFFHRSSVRGAVFELLREGQRVEFTPEESQKGPRAGDVRLIEG